LKVAAQAMQQDGREVFVPMHDSQGLLVYEADFGDVANLNAARLPLFARVDFRATFHPSGRAGRWQIYLDVINVLNRDNAGQIDTRLEYDPASDRPQIVEDRTAALSILPSLGIRFRF
jgi:hypothetical protein